MRRRVAAATATLSGALLLSLFLLLHSRNERPLHVDRWAANWAVAHRPGWAVHLSRAVTLLGTTTVVYPVLIVVAFGCAWRRRQWWMLGAPVILFAAQTIRYLIADAVERPRPPISFRLTGSSGWSFPSGHTTLATAGFGLATTLLLMSLPKQRAGVAVTSIYGLGTAIVAVAVGLSRVALGVHWLTDVIGGWLLGCLVIALMIVAIPVAPQDVSGPQ